MMRKLILLTLFAAFMSTSIASAGNVQIDTFWSDGLNQKTNHVDYATGVGMLFGQGYDTFTEDSSGRCVTVEQTAYDARNQDSTVRETVFKFELVESRQQLAQKLGVGVSTSLKSGWGKVNATASYVDEQKMDQYSLYILITTQILVPFETATNVKLLPEMVDLARTNPKAFRIKCGNEFVATVHRGGSMYAVLRLETSSQEHYKHAQGMLRAKVGTYQTSISLSTEIQKATQDEALKIFLLQQGGTSHRFPNNVESLINRIQDFQEEVVKFPIPLTATTMPYNQLQNYPLEATVLDTNVQEDILSYLNQRKMVMMKLRNDVDYILASKFQFAAFDEAKMDEALQLVNRQLNKINFASKKCLRNFDYCQYPEDLENVAVELPERLIIPVADNVCRPRVNEACGVNYKEATSAACGVVSFQSKRDPLCGVESYQIKESSACEPELYSVGRSEHCGVDLYLSGTNGDICGYDYNDYCYKGFESTREPREPIGRCNPIKEPKTCRAAQFGVERYNSCRHPSNGVDTYKSCRHPSHGVEIFKECQHESFGIKQYGTCRHVTHSVSDVKSCNLLEKVDLHTGRFFYKECALE